MTDSDTALPTTTNTPAAPASRSHWRALLSRLPLRVLPGSRRAWLWVAAGLGTFAVLWTVLMGLWLPGWLRPRVEAGASQALGMPVRLGAISVQPWTLRVVLDDLSVGDPQAPWLVLPRSEARLSLLSVRYLAPVLSQFTLRRPQVWLERQTPDRFNLSPMLDHLHAQPPAPADAEPARFALHNLRIEDGSIRYTDRVLRQEHLIDALRLGLPFLSNLPSDIATEVQPLLEARIDGSPLRITGRTRPFAPGRPTELALDWQKVPLKPWAEAARPLLPPSSRIDLNQGELDAQLRIGFEQPSAAPQPVLRISGRLALRDIDLRAPAAGWHTRWTGLTLDGLDVTPLQRQARVGSIDWQGLQHEESRPTITPQASASPASAPSAQPATTPAGPAWRWAVDKVRVNASRLALMPGGRTPLPELGPVQLQADGLSSAADAKPATLGLDVRDHQGARLTVQGQTRLAALPGLAPASAAPGAATTSTQPHTTLHAELHDAHLPTWLRALGLPLASGIGDGRLTARINFSGDTQGITLNQGQAQLSQLRMALAQSPDHLALRQLDLQGVQARVRLQGGPVGLEKVQASSLTIDQLDAAASRDPQAQWRWLRALAQPVSQSAGRSGAAAPAASTPTDKTPPPASPPLAWQLAELRCQACKLAVQDDSVSPSARVALTALTLNVQGASQDLSKPLKVMLRTQAQGNGTLAVDGTVRPQPLAVDAQLGVKALDLRVLQPYLDPLLNLTLLTANTSANGRLRLSQPAHGGVDAQWQGRFGVNDLRTQDGVTHNDFVRWRALALDAMDVRWQGGALDADLGRIALDEFFGRVILHPDGHLNLADIRRAEKGAEQKSLTTPGATAAPPAPPAPAASSSASTSQPMRLRWQGIRLDRGRIDFTDNFVKPNYSARLNQVQGTISAVSSQATTPAEVMLTGALDDGAPLRISGKLNPLGPRLYTDIEASARGIDLTRLSTYAERYAGYAIDKGSLSATVHYQVDQGRLQAQHQLFLDQLTFGQRVDSPDATKLPVQLAVALLKNSRGEINVNLPVGGSLDDPQFSIGGIVLRLIGNLLLKAVTSPFALLAGAFDGISGDGQDDLGFVAFAPGSAELDDAARAKLDTLVTKLRDKSVLKIDATGHADPAGDAEGLRQRALERALRNAKAQATGAPRGEVKVAPEERERWLKAAYQAAEMKKPRNVIGIAKTLPPAEMEALLKAQVPSDEAALTALANRRADQVSAYLRQQLGPERVGLNRSVVGPETAPPQGGTAAPPSRVQFELR